MDGNENWCRYADCRPNLHHQIKWVSSLVAVPNDLPLPPASIIQKRKPRKTTIIETKEVLHLFRWSPHTHTWCFEYARDVLCSWSKFDVICPRTWWYARDVANLTNVTWTYFKAARFDGSVPFFASKNKMNKTTFRRTDNTQAVFSQTSTNKPNQNQNHANICVCQSLTSPWPGPGKPPP